MGLTLPGSVNCVGQERSRGESWVSRREETRILQSFYDSESRRLSHETCRGQAQESPVNRRGGGPEAGSGQSRRRSQRIALRTCQLRWTSAVGTGSRDRLEWHSDTTPRRLGTSTRVDPCPKGASETTIHRSRVPDPRQSRVYPSY